MAAEQMKDTCGPKHQLLVFEKPPKKIFT